MARKRSRFWFGIGVAAKREHGALAALPLLTSSPLFTRKSQIEKALHLMAFQFHFMSHFNRSLIEMKCKIPLDFCFVILVLAQWPPLEPEDAKAFHDFYYLNGCANEEKRTSNRSLMTAKMLANALPFRQLVRKIHGISLTIIGVFSRKMQLICLEVETFITNRFDIVCDDCKMGKFTPWKPFSDCRPSQK